MIWRSCWGIKLQPLLFRVQTKVGPLCPVRAIDVIGQDLRIWGEQTLNVEAIRESPLH
jgi:hypothetical protein